MASQETVNELVRFIQSQSERIHINESLFNIYEGELKPFIDAELKKQLGKNSAADAMERSRCTAAA